MEQKNEKEILDLFKKEMNKQFGNRLKKNYPFWIQSAW